MTRLKCICWLIIVFFSTFFTGLPIAAQELQPHNVIVRSSYQESTQLEPFTQHTSKILEPAVLHEPYRPPINVGFYKFDEIAALNIQVSGFTRSFGGLSEVFLGEKGKLENAYLLFQSEEYAKAEDKLADFTPTQPEIKHKASLLKGWIMFKSDRFDEALNYAKYGFTIANTIVSRESFYLASLVLHKQQKWDELAELYKNHKDRKDRSFWDARFSLMHLFALTSLNRWKSVNEFITQIDTKQFIHTKLYHVFYEVSGVADFKRKKYKSALSHLETAHSLNPEISYRKRINQYLVWLNYYLENYNETLSLLDRLVPLQLIDNTDEIQYLRLSCLINLGQWQKAQQVFSQVPSDSAFFNYSAFKIQVKSDQHSIEPELKERLKSISFDFSEMKFQSELKKGNVAFKEGKYEIAEKHYLKAMSANVDTGDYYLAQFNLGLTYILLKDFAKARISFLDLAQFLPEEHSNRLYYHLLYVLYQLEFKTEFTQYLNLVVIESLNDQQDLEIQTMQGNILLSDERNQEASLLFFNLWKKYSWLASYESAIYGLYKTRQYKRLLESLKSNPSLKSERLFLFEVRALLGEQKYKMALNEVAKTSYQSDQVTELLLEVWMANQLYQKVIDHVGHLLKSAQPEERRLLYYLSLGDAHFNLKQYSESKNQFYRSLSLTNDARKKSLIQYNIALIAYQTKDYQSFIKETNVILKNNDLIPEIRYTLTQLLVDHYQNSGKPEIADSVLHDYIQRYKYQRTKAKNKRVQLLYQNGENEKCFQLSGIRDSEEDKYQKRDRIVLNGYCGLRLKKETDVIDSVNSEFKLGQSTYRKSELEFILAQAHFNLGQYEKSNSLVTSIDKKGLDQNAMFNTRLLQVDNLVQLKEFQNANLQLGDINQYRQSAQYPTALKLKAVIESENGNTDQSIRRLLRVYYLPNTAPLEKQKMLLAVCDTLAQDNRIPEARSYLEKINSKSLENEAPTLGKYQQLKEQLTISENPP